MLFCFLIPYKKINSFCIKHFAIVMISWPSITRHFLMVVNLKKRCIVKYQQLQKTWRSAYKMLVPVLEETCFYVQLNRFLKDLENALFWTFITLSMVTCTIVVAYEIIIYNTIWYSVKLPFINVSFSYISEKFIYSTRKWFLQKLFDIIGEGKCH